MLTCYRYGWSAHRYAGVNAIDGTTVVAGSPDTPTSRRVQLLSGLVHPVIVAERWSVASGAYEFDRLTSRQAGDGYTVIGYDHTGVHDPVAKANLIPTPMPPDPAEHP